MRFALPLLSIALLSMTVVTGCANDEPAPVKAPADAMAAASDEHDHSGWWCPEHGVPEENCTRCDASLVAEFKEQGDWCEEHDLPDSQCFVCHPELEEKFAEQYVAKYGEQPPKPTE